MIGLTFFSISLRDRNCFYDTFMERFLQQALSLGMKYKMCCARVIFRTNRWGGVQHISERDTGWGTAAACYRYPARRIRTIRLPQMQKTLTISIGCCLVEHAHVCFHDVYERSEQALYRARKKVEIRLLFVRQPTSKLASRLYVLHVKA